MKKYIITGLLIWIPLGITLWVLQAIVTSMDHLALALLPPALRPKYDIPGLGVLLTILIVMLTGLFASNIIGQRLLRLWERLLGSIPVVKSIYSGVKQVSDTIFTPGGQAFRKALLVQYPRQGSWTIAFLTGKPGGDIVNHLEGEFVSVYVPTTPNPTSGFFLMMRKDDVIELDMTVDDALKYVVSMGVVPPNGKKKR